MDEKEILKNATAALQALLALQKKSEDTLDGAVDGIIGKLGDRVTEDEKKEIRDSIMALGEKFKGDACKDEKPEELKDEEETEETAEVETEETEKPEKPELVDGVEPAEGENDEDDDEDEGDDDEIEAETETTEKVKAEDGDLDETAEVETETEKVKDTDARMDKLIQDAIKACGLENEDDVVKNAFIAGIKYGDQSGKAMAHDSVNGYSDALDAYDMITAEVKERMNAIAEAAEDVKGVLGKIKATAYDAAEEVYLDACKQLGINCNRLTARDAFMAYNAGHKKQKVVNIDPAIGVPGSQAAFLGEVITVQNYLSDGTAAAGQFVWNGTATVNPVSGGAIGVGKVATGNGTGGGALAGLAVRLITGVLPDTSDGQLTYERGELVTVAIRGDFFVTATGSATAGQSVNVVTATGAMTYGTPGTGEVATGWTVTEGGTTGDLIVISNHG